jgi:hypothetical protein
MKALLDCSQSWAMRKIMEKVVSKNDVALQAEVVRGCLLLTTAWV